MTTTQIAIKLLCALATAFGCSLVFTPLVKMLANRVGAIDVPKDARRMHDHPIPRMGGLAIFLGFVISAVIFADIDKKLLGVLIGGTVIVFVGIIDDIVALPAKAKLFCQIIASLIPVLFGVIIPCPESIFGSVGSIILTIIAIPVTMFWIIGVTNAVNFIDGLDGLCGGVSSVICAGLIFAVLSVSGENLDTALFLAALIGGCLGFLPYNFNPASIFMGDTGSLLLGFTMSSICVVSLFRFENFATFFVPVIALGHPIADTTCAIIRRVRKGLSPMTADRGHFHHKLVDKGFNVKQAVLIMYSTSFVLAALANLLVGTGSFRFIVLAGSLVACGYCFFSFSAKIKK